MRNGGSLAALWSRTIVNGMAIRGLHVPASGSLNFAFLCPLRGPPPCDPRELMAAVRPRAHSLLQYQHGCGKAEFRVNFALRDELVLGIETLIARPEIYMELVQER